MRYYLTVCALASAMGSFAHANAQEVVPGAGAAGVSADAAVAEDEIIVTANKREQNIKDVGLTISAVSGEELAARRVESLADIAQVVPGLTYANSITNTPVFTLRGVGFYETSLAAYPTTSVYIDEVPLPFPVQTTRTAFDLERVEVLKGPQGTLFGNNATGGAINYIAAKPTDRVEAGGSISYGRFNTITGDAFVSGPLADGLNARIAMKASQGDPWQYSYTRDDKSGATDYFAGRLLLDWQASDAVRFQLNVNGWRDRSEPMTPQFLAAKPENPSPGLPVNTYPVAPDNARAADWTPFRHPRGDNRLGQVALRADVDLEAATLTSITSYIDYKHRQSFDADATALEIFDSDPVSGRIRSFSQELRLAGDAGRPFRWVVGANYSSDKVREFDYLYFRDGSTGQIIGMDSLLFDSTQKMRNYAGFANAEYDISDGLTFKAGVRYTKSDRAVLLCNSDPVGRKGNLVFSGLSQAVTGQAVSPPLRPEECFPLGADGIPIRDDFEGKVNEDNVSWRVGLDWKAQKDLLFYANISRGYKAGSYPTLAAASASQYVPVTQEKVTAYEAGVKAAFADRLISFDAAAFYYSYADKQIKAKQILPIFGPLDLLTNIPKSSIRGGEVQLTLRPHRYFTTSAAVVYTDATIDKFIGTNAAGQDADFSGTTMPFAPKWQVSISSDLTVPVGGNLEASLGATFFHQSGAPTTIGGTDPFVLRPYELLDLRAGLAHEDGSWSLSAYAKNVTNTFYWTNVAASNDTVVRYTGMPVTYGVTLGIKFR